MNRPPDGPQRRPNDCSSPCPPQCPPGATGATGPAAPPGQQGATGTPGTMGATGATGPEFAAGTFGDVQIHSLTGPGLDVVGPPVAGQGWKAADGLGTLRADPSTGATLEIGAVGDTFPAPGAGFVLVGQLSTFLDFLALHTSLFGGADIHLIRLADNLFTLGVNGFPTLIEGEPTVILGGNAFAVAGADLSLGAENWLARSTPRETTNANTVERLPFNGATHECTVHSLAPAGTHTLDATPAVIATVPLDPGGNDFMVEVVVNDAAKANSAVYSLRLRAHSDGVSAVVSDVQVNYTSADAALVAGGLTTGAGQTTITFATAGTNLQVNATGGGALDLWWSPVTTNLSEQSP